MIRLCFRVASCWFQESFVSRFEIPASLRFVSIDTIIFVPSSFLIIVCYCALKKQCLWWEVTGSNSNFGSSKSWLWTLAKHETHSMTKPLVSWGMHLHPVRASTTHFYSTVSSFWQSWSRTSSSRSADPIALCIAALLSCKLNYIILFTIVIF